MGMVFPSSIEEKCPRHDCESLQVERLATEADFGGLTFDSPARMLWLCLVCQRPFKLVSGAEAQVAAATARGRRAPVVQLRPFADSVHVTERRIS